MRGGGSRSLAIQNRSQQEGPPGSLPHSNVDFLSDGQFTISIGIVLHQPCIMFSFDLLIYLLHLELPVKRFGDARLRRGGGRFTRGRRHGRWEGIKSQSY